MARTHQREMADGLPDALPWLRMLPSDDLQRFTKEFVEIAEACGSLGSFDPLGLLLSKWRNTAYAWSRPEVLQALQADHAREDFDEPVNSPRYEVTGAGRVWFLIDDAKHRVLLTAVTLGHPSKTDR